MTQGWNRRDFLRYAGYGAAAVPLLGVTGCIGSETAVNRTSAAGPDRPNVILVILDTLRKDHVGAYGNPGIETPNMDALIGEGLRFDRAFPESLVSIPIRRAIHTGLRTFPFRDWVPQAGVEAPVYGWQRIPDDQTTFAETLKPEGWTTAIFTDAYHEWQPSMNFNRGFDTYEWIRGNQQDQYRPIDTAPQALLDRWMTDWAKGTGVENVVRQYAANIGDSRRGEEDWFAPRVFRTAAAWLQEAAVEPFMMVVDSYDPHEPWDPPLRDIRRYSDDNFEGPEPISPIYGDANYLDERSLARMRALYAGEVTLVDRWLGRFLDVAESTGVLDRSVVMVVSDHGITIGERGITGKMPFDLHKEIMDIPLFLRHPEGRGAGTSTDYFASTHDLMPTLLGLTGVESRKPMDGVDLSPLLEGNEPRAQRPYLTSGFNNYVWARDDDHVLIARNDGEEPKLYDLAADPEQLDNIAAREPRTVRRLYDRVIDDAGGEPPPTYDLEEMGLAGGGFAADTPVIPVQEGRSS